MRRDFLSRWIVWCAALAAMLPLGACGGLPRKAVPVELVEHAVVDGMPDVRWWGDAMTAEIEEAARVGMQREVELLASQGVTQLPDAHYLALSGGGENGAFGAGLLCGWTEAGTRPAFKYVTGISTGALIAPFAFLGPDYDYVLRDVYTQVSSRDIFRLRGFIDGLFDDSLADTTPLRELLEKHVDERVLRRVAEEHLKGRNLLIGTTNLDAQRPVLWNMGRIATSGHPDSLELFRRVLLASASIPGFFPPVMIEVEAGGETYDEMHVDGGTAAQVFLYPAALSIKALGERFGVQRKRHVYIVRNSKLSAEWEPIRRRSLNIAARAVSTLIKTQGVGDLYRIYLGAERDELDYNLASIPDDFSEKPDGAFDPVYMTALFNRGFEMARAGYPWAKAPPGFEPPQVVETKAASAR